MKTAAITKEEILQRIRAEVSALMGMDEVSITPASSFDEEIGFDSLDRVEFVMALEEAYDIPEISDSAANKWKTVQDAVDYVAAKLKCAD